MLSELALQLVGLIASLMADEIVKRSPARCVQRCRQQDGRAGARHACDLGQGSIVVVHVFDPDAREYYALEELWADAPRVDWVRG